MLVCNSKSWRTLLPTDLAVQFRQQMERSYGRLLAIPPAWADVPWKEGKWTRKQVLGHLLDSATNNRQRFVRASVEQGDYQGPTYDQKPWVAIHGYAEQSWDTLLRWFHVEHEILAAVVDHISADRFETRCVVAGEAPVTLRFLIEDYIAHQLWHMDQLTGPPSR